MHTSSIEDIGSLTTGTASSTTKQQASTAAEDVGTGAAAATASSSSNILQKARLRQKLAAAAQTNNNNNSNNRSASAPKDRSPETKQKSNAAMSIEVTAAAATEGVPIISPRIGKAARRAEKLKLFTQSRAATGTTPAATATSSSSHDAGTARIKDSVAQSTRLLNKVKRMSQNNNNNNNNISTTL